MDAFLCWNTTNNATKYEQKKREEVQLRILSRFKRSVAHEEMRTLVPSHHQKRCARGVRNSSASAPGRNMGSRNGNGNNKPSGNSHTYPHPEDSSITRSVMSLPHQKGGRILESMGSPIGNEEKNVGFHTKYRSHLKDPSVTDRSITRSTHRVSSMSDSFLNENPSNNTRPTVTYGKAKDHGINIPIDEEEEDIVCCDGGHCHEGTKNLW
jgi:hypothetical protein